MANSAIYVRGQKTRIEAIQVNQPLTLTSLLLGCLSPMAGGLRLVRINTLFQHSEKYRHPREGAATPLSAAQSTN